MAFRTRHTLASNPVLHIDLTGIICLNNTGLTGLLVNNYGNNVY
jgi:hypothetical protein